MISAPMIMMINFQVENGWETLNRGENDDDEEEDVDKDNSV